MEVTRLRGYAWQQTSKMFSSLSSQQELWISLTGRNIDDHDPIVKVIEHPREEISRKRTMD